MIVVIGRPLLQPAAEGGEAAAAGLPVGIARAVAAAGAEVQLAGSVGADADGDALFVDLARSGIGHAAVLRDPARPTPHAVAPVDEQGAADLVSDAVLADPVEGLPLGAGAGVGPAAEVGPAIEVSPAIDPADLDLALRYLSSFSVLVIGDRLGMEALAVAAEAADYAGAQVVVAVPPGWLPATHDLPPALASATLFEAPDADPDGAFATLVGRYAAALDAGDPPGDAFTSALGAGRWEPAGVPD